MVFLHLIITLTTNLLLFLLIELIFYIRFKCIAIPNANKRLPHIPFRTYDNDRPVILEPVDILKRIIERTKGLCQYGVDGGGDENEAFEMLLKRWFKRRGDDDDDDEDWFVENTRERDIEEVRTMNKNDDDDDDRIHKIDMDELIAWAYFTKKTNECTPDEWNTIHEFYSIMKQRCSLTFPPGHSPNYKARLLSFENVDPIHRPLCLVVLIFLVYFIGWLILWCRGFRRYHIRCQLGQLSYWYRPGDTNTKDKEQQEEEALPMVFFHGVAPGGLTFYLPFILHGLAPFSSNNNKKKQKRALFLFEHKPISQIMSTNYITEEETANAVLQALDNHNHDDDKIILCGHSFGTFQLTWCMNHPKLRMKVQQLVLLDPISIMLSDPDVLLNFIYARTKSNISTATTTTTTTTTEQQQQQQQQQQRHVQWKRFWVRLIFGSELYTEWYVRRRFSWYNSELWLEDLPSHVRVLVFLSGQDAIIDAEKIRSMLWMHNDRVKNEQRTQADDDVPPHVEMIYCDDAGHGSCIKNREVLKEIKNVMDEQEHSILYLSNERD